MDANKVDSVDVRLNEPELYDSMTHGLDGIRTLPQADEVWVVTKDYAIAGQSRAVISFMCDLNGEQVRAQATLPVRLLTSVLRVLYGRYGDSGIPHTR